MFKVPPQFRPREARRARSAAPIPRRTVSEREQCVWLRRLALRRAGSVALRPPAKLLSHSKWKQGFFLQPRVPFISSSVLPLASVSRSYTMNLMRCCDVEDCRQIARARAPNFFSANFPSRLKFSSQTSSFFFFNFYFFGTNSGAGAIHFVSPGFRDSANLSKYGLFDGVGSFPCFFGTPIRSRRAHTYMGRRTCFFLLTRVYARGFMPVEVWARFMS